MEESEQPVTAAVDEQAFLRVVENLVGNAIKYTESGSVKVTLEATDDTAKISVADTGRGIPPESIEAVFDKFTKLPETGGRGAGMGLALCRALVEEMGGRIWVESKVGFGSTFFVEIPRHLEGEGEPGEGEGEPDGEPD
jgi:signal transduction histidine kinase